MRPSDLKISISGIRGIVGEGLTPQLVIKFAEAFSSYIGGGEIAVAGDTRPSREMVACAVMSGLLSCGASPVDCGILPIPTLQIFTKDRNLDGAISITASHNPVQWNALKLIRRGGAFLSPNQAGELLDFYYQGKFSRVASPGFIRRETEAFAVHKAKILALADVPLIRRKRPKVVIDPCGGAAAPYAGPFLEALGAEVICINCEVGGAFPRNPEPVPANLGRLCEVVRQQSADLGLAQDADADRLAAVDETGTPIGEEYTLALAVEHYLRSREKTPVVVNLSTSRVIDDITAREGVALLRTKVGEINVSRAMAQSGAKIGGEGNGGIIMADVHHCRDSFSGMALILEALAWSGRPLSGLKAELPCYSMIKQKIPASFREAKRALSLLRDTYEKGRMDTTDGLRVDFPDFWFHVRPSNTEPVLRLQVEAREKEKARLVLEEIRGILERGR
jgi:phosphomannomutase